VYYLGVTKRPTPERSILGLLEGEPLVKVPLVKNNAPENATPYALDARREG